MAIYSAGTSIGDAGTVIGSAANLTGIPAPSTANVQTALSGSTISNLGTTTICYMTGAYVGTGVTTPSSNLQYARGNTTGFSQRGGGPSGTWRNMSYGGPSGGIDAWIRTA